MEMTEMRKWMWFVLIAVLAAGCVEKNGRLKIDRSVHRYQQYDGIPATEE
jgi:hypothetical protein